MQKTRGFLVAASAAKFWKRDIRSALERAFPGFLGDIFGCSTPSKKRCFSTQEFTRFLSTVSSQRRSTRSDVSFQTICLNSKFVPWFAIGVLGTSTQTVFSFGFIFIFTGDVSLRTGPTPPLQWLPFPPQVAAVFITPKGAESPGSGRIGVIGALVFFSSEAV